LNSYYFPLSMNREISVLFFKYIHIVARYMD